ncbi:unnamed protein product [Mytilus coruscus]|uniref:DDE Tnp4 domain-containing protein n=1 Tax=Mytilus coruscus TaxID=42192 RepID=A0A6J8DLR9_MYTCO|nr:unnamed protein product [Mytilus coruscus]
MNNVNYDGINKLYENCFRYKSKNEMNDCLDYKTVKLQDGHGTKKRRTKKPKWCDRLTVLWNKVCEAEKDVVKCKITSRKREFKDVFVMKRKDFGREAKRHYWRNKVNGNGGNMLRTYRTFKTSIHTKDYMHRRAYSHIRNGAAPIRIETARFERLSLHQRTCETDGAPTEQNPFQKLNLGYESQTTPGRRKLSRQEPESRKRKRLLEESSSTEISVNINQTEGPSNSELLPEAFCDFNVGDEVMADRGFTIVDFLFPRRVKLNIPAYTKCKPQLSNEDVTTTRRIAHVRIHVERAIRKLKVFKVLSGTVTVSSLKNFDDILIVCSALVNLRSDLIRDVNVDTD